MKNNVRIPLDLLETFIVFAQSPHITAAARVLGLSQPAVTVRLRKLEALMPHPLFVFQGKKKVLSHFGKALYQSVHGKLDEVERAIERVQQQYLDPGQIRIKVGVRREILVLLAQKLRFPGKILFLNLSNQEILSQLSQNQIDVGITHERPDDPNVLSKDLFSQSVRFCCSKKLSPPISLKRALSREFLKSLPCLAYKEVEPPFLTEWAKEAGFSWRELNVRAVCEDWMEIMKMVENGDGYSLIPSGITTHSKEVWELEIPPKIIPKRKFYLLYSKALRHVPGIREMFQDTP